MWWTKGSSSSACGACGKAEDLLREMVELVAEELMSAEADALCNAGCRTRTPERTNRRNGYRTRRWDTRP